MITSFLSNTVGPERTVHEETPMARTGLVLRPIILAIVDQLGRRQPDWVLMSHELKRIAILDPCRPSDVLLSQRLMAAKSKQHAYEPVKEALSYYTGQGWIHIFPWVVGDRGMIDPRHGESLMKFHPAKALASGCGTISTCLRPSVSLSPHSVLWRSS